MLRRISNQLVIVLDERPEWNVREPACIWRADLNLYSSRRGIYSRDNPIARSTVSIYIAEELARLAFILACVARITGRYYAPSSSRRSADDRTHRKSRRFIRFFFSPLPSHRRGTRSAVCERSNLHPIFVHQMLPASRTASGRRCRDRGRSIAPCFVRPRISNRARARSSPSKRKSASRTRRDATRLEARTRDPPLPKKEASSRGAFSARYLLRVNFP